VVIVAWALDQESLDAWLPDAQLITDSLRFGS